MEVGDVDTLDVPEFDIDDVGEVVVDIDGVVERVLVGDFEMDEEKERVGVTLGDEEKLKSTSGQTLIERTSVDEVSGKTQLIVPLEHKLNV